MSQANKTVKLFIMEEAELYRRMYERLPFKGPVTVLGVADEVSDISRVVVNQVPDVLVLGTKKLESTAVKELLKVREEHPDLGIVLLFVLYKNDDVLALRELTKKGNGGVAVFLKQSLDQLEQLVGIIAAVNHGQVVLDPTLANFMFAGKPECPFLEELTPKEAEILNLVARGFTNQAIAKTLFIDIKTVEHHLNSLYSKLKADSDFTNKHPRVTAARLYLQETKQLIQN